MGTKAKSKQENRRKKQAKHKSDRKENQQNNQIKTSTIGDKVIFTLIALLIIGAPLFQGAFFQKEIMIINIISFAIFLIFLFNKKQNQERLTVFNSPYDYIGLLFILAYLLPIITFQWASLRDAIDIFIRYANYYVIYLMVKDIVENEKYKAYFAKTLILGSVIVALIGILGAAGYIKLEDVVMGNRISSTFQYPNTLAALMMSIFFLTTGLIHKSEKYIGKLIYGAAGFVMLFTFIFTYSRAAWLLFPIFALLYLIFVSGKDRIESILYFIIVLVPNILVLQPFTNQLAIEAETKPKALVVFIIGVGIFKVLYSIVILIQAKLQDKYYKLIYGFLAAALAGTAIFAYIALNTTEPLTFDNLAREENRTNQIQRTVKNIEENKQYTLKIEAEPISESEEEAHWPFRVRIYSVDDAGERELLEEILEGQEENQVTNNQMEISFTTLETTENISVYFTNIYPKTKVTFKDAKVIDQEENIVGNIKLKYKYIPESLIARFNAIDLGESSSATRLTYYKDSFSIFKAKPIFGGGGGTWNALYAKYQSLPYSSTEAHNYFVQTLVETGIVGVVVLTLLILAFVIHLLKAWRRKDTLTISILFSILSLLGHSGLDFNFSFHSVPLIFWALIALLETKTFENINLNIKKVDLGGKATGIGIPVILTLPLLLFSISLYSANAMSVSNSQTINEIPLEESISKMEKAVKLDPFHPNMRIDLAKAQRTYGFEADDFSLVEKAENNLKKAVKHSPHMPAVLFETASHYISVGQFEDAFEYLNKSTQSAPLKPHHYETKSDAYMVVADYYLSQGDLDSAIDIYSNDMLSIIDEIKTSNEKTEKPVALTQNTLQNIFRAKYFVDNQDKPEKLGELNDIVYMSYLDLEGEVGVPAPWRKWNSEGGDMYFEVTNEGLKVYNSGEDYGIASSRYFDLEANTSYEVEVLFAKESTEKELRFYMISDSGEKYQTTEKINLENINNEFTHTFTTTEDIEPGNQNVRFDHLGNSSDYFIVKSVVVKRK